MRPVRGAVRGAIALGWCGEWHIHSGVIPIPNPQVTVLPAPSTPCDETPAMVHTVCDKRTFGECPPGFFCIDPTRLATTKPSPLLLDTAVSPGAVVVAETISPLPTALPSPKSVVPVAIDPAKDTMCRGHFFSAMDYYMNMCAVDIFLVPRTTT